MKSLKLHTFLKYAGCPRWGGGGGRSPNSDNDEQGGGGEGDKKSTILPDVLCEWHLKKLVWLQPINVTAVSS